jgi:hypothetical protein
MTRGSSLRCTVPGSALLVLVVILSVGCGGGDGASGDGAHDAAAGTDGSAGTLDASTASDATVAEGGADGSAGRGDDGGTGAGSDGGDGGGSCQGATCVQQPGPSVDLFEHPYYQCLRNFYVSTTGSDTKDGTTTSAAWATIAHADTIKLQAGDCINVAPGTYAKFNDSLKQGGSAASSTGYVAYRCTTPSFVSGTGCVITDTGGAVRAGMYSSNVYPNYLFFEGFDFVTTNQTVQNDVAVACAGPGTFGTAQTASLGCHHWWIVNNIISGHGQAGVNINDTEFLYTVHNRVTQNAHMGCVGYYGSGITYVVAKPVTGYQKTADDTNSGNNASLNLLGVQGPDFPFNQVVAWNDVGNNFQGCMNAADGPTDGNGIIIDTFNITSCNANTVDYPNKTLVAFNVVYDNGGGGVHVFSSANVTVANNSVYFNNSDPTQNGYDRPGIDVNCGAGKTGFGAGTDLFLNNIAYALPRGQSCASGTPLLGAEIPFSIGGGSTYVDGVFNTPGKNISYSDGTPCHATDSSDNATASPNAAWSCTTNKCQTEPGWVDVGKESTGTESSAPKGVNFALKAGSPAIGAGATEPYLPASSVDVGACGSPLSICPSAP